MTGRFQRVSRWQVTAGATSVLVGVGILLGRPEFLLAGVVPLVYLAASNATGVTEAEVVATRRLDPESPVPGETVTVAIEVENVGDSVLADLRVVDGVPAKLSVVDGSPRAAVGLKPGDATTVEYDVVARRGEHAFDPPTVRVRSLAGSSVYTGRAAQRGATELTCELAIEEFPLRERTVQYFGQVPTDTPGSGVEFHSTREYRPGDRMTRINWRRYAETGELTTVEYREARSATVVFVLDARPDAAVAAAPGRPSAVEYGLYAADRGVRVLRARGNRVGLTAVGADVDWAEPTRSRDAERRVAAVAAAVDDAGPRRAVADGGSAARELCRQLPADAQIVLLTPAVDEFPVAATRVFQAYGHPATVLSPDPTTGDSLGQRVARVDRATRLVALREAGARVVDWDPARPLSIALGETLERWVKR